MIYKLHEENT